MYLVTCNNTACAGQGFTERSGPGDFDDAVRCTTPEGTPEGSVEGCCSTAGHTHEEHVEHVRRSGDASNRPVTITVVPGSGPVLHLTEGH
jgi:hypothetical protein